ncbi:expansin family protein [Moniliophthora roreri]|nr:expansin family protein [Moniliophthora roreri]
MERGKRRVDRDATHSAFSHTYTQYCLLSSSPPPPRQSRADPVDIGTIKAGQMFRTERIGAAKWRLHLVSGVIYISDKTPTTPTYEMVLLGIYVRTLMLPISI